MIPLSFMAILALFVAIVPSSATSGRGGEPAPVFCNTTQGACEQCQQNNECGNYDTYFTAAGKAVFQVEYKFSLAKFCTKANAANRNAILKNFDLFDKPYTPCR